MSFKVKKKVNFLFLIKEKGYENSNSLYARRVGMLKLKQNIYLNGRLARPDDTTTRTRFEIQKHLFIKQNISYNIYTSSDPLTMCSCFC